MASRRVLWPSVVSVVLVVTLSAQEARPTFEVASVKRAVPVSGPRTRVSPNVFFRSGDTLEGLIRYAYSVQRFQVLGGPAWARAERFEVNAKATEAVPDTQMRLMVRRLLEERFKLVLRSERQEMQHLSLVVARADGRLGPELTKCEDPSNPPASRPIAVPRDGFAERFRCAQLSELVMLANAFLQTPVVDATGMTGLWNYALAFSETPSAGTAEVTAPPLATALREQLGLRLEPKRGPVEVLIIDSVQQPTEN
jgi:uncharacterized protein (TIGR03435 family)